MNKYIFKLFAFMIAVATVVSCSSEFLDAPAQGALSGETLSTSEDGVNASLIAAYKMMGGFTNTVGNTWGSAPSNYIFHGASDDTHKGSEPSDNPGGYHEIQLHQWSPGLAVFSHKFGAVYEGVKRSNSAILIATDFLAGGGDEDLGNRVIAEAKFLRAWFHFEAYKVFKNVPYYYETDIDFRKANDQEVLPLIVADLEAAIAGLPDTRANVGRSDKIVGAALLGKVKMFQNDYSGAKTEFEKVVNSGRFALNPCYNDNFVIALDNSVESIFALQTSVNDGDGNGSNSNFLERLAAPHAGSHTDCCGFNNPTIDYANSFRTDESGLPVADYNSVDIEVGSDLPVDPRIDWTMGRTGVPYLDWGLHSDGWIRGSGWAGFYSPKKNMKLTTDAGAGGWATNQLNGKNVEFIRYSDVLLMLAECEVEVGSLETAREYVNMIRTRAGNCAQGPVDGPLQVAIDDASITWANYSVGTYDDAWTDQSAARDAVRRERRLELGTEGHRLFDLRRWGVLEETMSAFHAFEADKVGGALLGVAAVEAKHYAFPLPLVEIELSGGALIQNDGF